MFLAKRIPNDFRIEAEGEVGTSDIDLIKAGSVFNPQKIGREDNWYLSPLREENGAFF